MKKLVNKSIKCIMLLVFVIFAGTSGIANAKAPGFDNAEKLTNGDKVSCTVMPGKEKLYYFFNDKSGRIDISLKEKCEQIWQSTSFKLCDAKGNVIYSTEVAAGTTFSDTFYLRAGDYYIRLGTIAEYDAQNCYLTYKYTSSDESNTEWLVSDEFTNCNDIGSENFGSDDSIKNANELYCRTSGKIKGQFGYNDSKDFYKVEIPTKGKLTLKYSSKKEYAEYRIYKGKNTEVASGRIESGKTSLSKTINVTKGTYYICMYYGELTGTNNDADDGGFYNFSIKYKNTNVVKGECKIECKGKTITVCEVPDIFNPTTPESDHKNATYAQFKKVWGTNAKSEKSIRKAKKRNGGFGQYVYKKGKSSLTLTNSYSKGKFQRSAISVNIKDKNMTANGVKIGTSKAKAMKLLKKKFSADAVYYKDGKIYVMFGPYYPMVYTVKGGKVVSFGFSHS